MQPADTDRTEDPDTGEPERSWEQTLADWHQKLAALNPDTAPHDRGLVDAVIAHLDCDVIDDEQECVWRRYAYHAAAHLYAADDPRRVNAATDYVDSLHVCGQHHQALPVQHEVVAFHRRAGDIAALLLARAQYASLLHATGCCHDAAREITSVWTLWRRDWNCDTELGRPLMDTLLEILLGCDRVTDAQDVIAHAPTGRHCWQSSDQERQYRANQRTRHTHPRVHLSRQHGPNGDRVINPKPILTLNPTMHPATP